MKRKNICIMGIPEREEKKEGTEGSIFKAIMTGNKLIL